MTCSIEHVPLLLCCVCVFHSWVSDFHCNHGYCNLQTWRMGKSLYKYLGSDMIWSCLIGNRWGYQWAARSRFLRPYEPALSDLWMPCCYFVSVFVTIWIYTGIYTCTSFWATSLSSWGTFTCTYNVYLLHYYQNFIGVWLPNWPDLIMFWVVSYPDPFLEWVQIVITHVITIPGGKGSGRSEERRGGKECWSGGSPYH